MAYTKLERAEVAQLLELFYTLREDDDVVVDTDTAPLEEISTDSVAAGARNGSQTTKVRECECELVIMSKSSHALPHRVNRPSSAASACGQQTSASVLHVRRRRVRRTSQSLRSKP